MKQIQTVKWLIEDFDCDNSLGKIADVAKARGYEVEIYNQNRIWNVELWKESFNDNSCVIPVTSIQAAHQIMKYKPNWYPGPWYDTGVFDCKNYYAYFGKHLFNDKYMMLPAGDVLRRKLDIFRWFGVDDCVFIRPSSGNKTFTGQVFEKKRFEHDYGAVIGYGTRPTDLVVVSTPKTITAEYRCVVTDKGEVIASSQYCWEKKKQYDVAPQHIVEYAQVALKESGYAPHPVFCLDVATDAEGSPWVLEVGCFNCSGLYCCDKEEIVDKVSEIAYNDYKDFYGKE